MYMYIIIGRAGASPLGHEFFCIHVHVHVYCVVGTTGYCNVLYMCSFRSVHALKHECYAFNPDFSSHK